MKRPVLYVDERTGLGKDAIFLFRSLSACIIPVDGGIPFATWGRSKFEGLSELRILTDLLK